MTIKRIGTSTLKQNKTGVKFVRVKRQRQIVKFASKIRSPECIRGLNRLSRFLQRHSKVRATFLLDCKFMLKQFQVYESMLNTSRKVNSEVLLSLQNYGSVIS